MESKSSLDIKNFMLCAEYANKNKPYNEISRDKFVILSSKIESLDKKLVYHLIVTNNFDNYYSIYQTSSIAKAIRCFDYYAPILNPILKCKFTLQALIKFLKRLTKITRSIMNDDWTLCHVLANFNIFEIFDQIKNNKSVNEIFIKCRKDLLDNINKQTKRKKYTALHLAIKVKSFKFIDKLVQFANQSIDFRLADCKGKFCY